MKRIQDLGELEEDRAGEDPKWVECPECGGDGEIRDDEAEDGYSTCQRCDGSGRLINPDLLP